MSFVTRALDINGDILLENGRSVLIKGGNAVAQKAQSRMRFFLGEWFLDVLQGVPYFRDILIKNPNIGLVTGIFRKVLANTPGVASVVSLSVSVDSKTRKAKVVGFARTVDGEEIDVVPFTDSSPLSPYAVTIGGIEVTIGGIPVLASP